MGWIFKGVLDLGEFKVPFYLRTEHRTSSRYSVGREKVNIKLPLHYTKPMIEEELEKVKKWLSLELEKNQELRSKFSITDYSVNNTITVQGTEYSIKIIEENRHSNAIKVMENNILQVKLQLNLSPIQKQTVLKKLLSRIFASIYYEFLSGLVIEVNKQYFQEDINKISIKYNKSNWGSCSGNKNINLSSRLLLCPDVNVIKSVIVHELAHLKEMNHSKAFWDLVYNAMPDYKKHHAWLKKNGRNLDF